MIRTLHGLATAVIRGTDPENGGSGRGGHVNLGTGGAGQFFVQDFLGSAGAGTATRGNTQGSTQLVQGVHAVPGGATNLLVGYRVANTDVHGESRSSGPLRLNAK